MNTYVHHSAESLLGHWNIRWSNTIYTHGKLFSMLVILFLSGNSTTMRNEFQVEVQNMTRQVSVYVNQSGLRKPLNPLKLNIQ